jgi:hypothetical protein
MTGQQGLVRQMAIGLTLALVLATTLAVQADAASITAPPAPGAGGHRGPHTMPFGLQSSAHSAKVGAPAVTTGLATASSAPAGAHLIYNGGRVISSPQINQVLWGGGSYLPQVTRAGSPSVASFFRDVFANSTYDTWLDSEYNTVSNSFNGTKTNQHITPGVFAGQVIITPSVTSTTIDDSQIQHELSSQIEAGHIPAPKADSQGNATSVYALFFPHGTTITLGGSTSLAPGGFCAYHGTVGSGMSEFYYSVLPDLTGVTGCGGGTDFSNTTAVMAHELTGMITDAEVGLATSASGPPLGWYDNANGEIGDICNTQQGNLTTGSGQTYAIQLEFSNAQNNCILPPAQPINTPVNDFGIAASPSAISVTAGNGGTSTISTSVTTGSAGTVNLSISGMGSGVAATLSAASVTAGNSTTLTITTTPSTAAGTYALTITGTEGTSSHTTAVTLIVSGGTSGAGGIVNGGFETGTLSGWTATGASETVISSGCQSGTYCAQLGGSSPTNGDSTITQTFTAPSGATGISLWYKMTCPDTVTYDWALATLKDNTGGATATLITRQCTTNSWTNVTGTLVAGHSYTLSLTSHDDNYPGDPTFTMYDNVSITSGSPPPPPGGIVNGGFEAGSLSGWTTSGSGLSYGVVSSGCHGGIYCARLGNTTPTNGDSTISQTFMVPAGKSQLSIWYKMTCPDTVTFDWTTITLQNNSTGATTNVLPPTCTTNAWTNVTASVAAGTSYTLTLTSHDDNYSADPSYTLYDDVTLN